MTKEELNLDYKKALEVWKDTMREGNYLLAVKSALEKQIPKDVVIHGFSPNRMISSISYACPICNKHIGRENFCKHCGQALGWGDIE